MNTKTVASTQLDNIKLFRKGKVRDVYDVGDKLLIVSTDRISCFDVVLPDCIPNKGAILTQLSVFWFELFRDMIPNHFITMDVNDFPKELRKHEDVLRGRSMLVKKTKPILFECVVRGYLAGSGWKEYQETQSVCGIKLPKGLKKSDKLSKPIFTPATKEESGHDMNVSYKLVKGVLGKNIAAKLKDTSIALYRKAAQFARERGIIIADTKFEFGILDDEIILIDEIFTPDSSRFWPENEYVPGKDQASFDKQFVRDYLETLNWDKNPPAPKLPMEVINKTSDKYLQAFKIITGRDAYQS